MEVERKKASRKESRTLSDIYYTKYKNIRNELTPDKGNLRLINDVDQPELGSDSMGQHTGRGPGDEAVPNGRRG